MKTYLNLIVISTAISLSSEESEGMFTSSTDITELLTTEFELARGLNEYIEQETQRLELLKSFVKEYQDMKEKAEENPAKFVENPLNSYLIIKKLTADFKELQKVVEGGRTENLFTNFTNQRTGMNLKWPSDEDLNGAAVGLMRLQDTYKLDTANLAKGIVNGQHYGPVLSANDCFEVGRQSYNNGDYYHTILWMEQALLQYDREPSDMKTIQKADILEYLAFSAYMTGNVRRALKLTNEMLAYSPDHQRAQGNQAYYQQTLKSKGVSIQKRGEDGMGDADEKLNIYKEQQKREDDLGEERVTYEKLCRGEDTMTVAERSKLMCRYTHGMHPFLTIAPVKEEELFLDPRLVMFYDIVTDEEIKTIKEMATPRFKRATVQNYKTGELETANYRVSKTAWLKEEEHSHVANIYKRTNEVTGLNMETSEELQVSNYGLGGHYEPHYDFARQEEKNAFASLGTGNRIATWLIYESDVDQGGMTVFLNLGISLKPVKRAAVFWYNLHQNGEGDDRTRHAACPVLAGTKWVSNFWIHERGQEFTRPCHKNPFQ